MKWFRVYTDIIDDLKVKRLSPFHFRFMVFIWAMTADGNETLPETDDVAFRLRMTEDEVKEAISTLVDKGFLDKDIRGKYRVHGWAKRQYKSDVSTERVKRFRKRSTKRFGNVSETPSDTEQNRTEQIQSACVSLDGMDLKSMCVRMINRHPNPHRRGPLKIIMDAVAEQLSDAVNPDVLAEKMERHHATSAKSEQWTKEDGRFCPKLEKWISSEAWIEEPPEPKGDGYMDAREMIRRREERGE